MTCKDCLYVEICKKTRIMNPSRNYATECKDFKDRSRFVELPCKVGDTVFCDLDYLVHPNHNANKNYPLDEAIVSEISKGINDKEPLFTVMNYELAEYSKFWLSEFGKYVFTKEQYNKAKPTKLSVRKMK